MTRIAVLGAERQAASSLALAYPHRRVLFLTDSAFLDGAELPNVAARNASPADWRGEVDASDIVVPLCPRWLQGQEDTSVARTLARIGRDFPAWSLPIAAEPLHGSQWVVKGDRWHRPDAPLSGGREKLDDIVDRHGCGLVFQPLQETFGTYIVTGRRLAADNVRLGLIRVMEERFFWDNILQAGETADRPDLLDASLHILDSLGHRGFFSLNWIDTPEGLKLTSLRPVPRAAFGTLLRAGVDLLEDKSAIQVSRPGFRFVAQPTYTSYRGLSA